MDSNNSNQEDISNLKKDLEIIQNNLNSMENKDTNLENQINSLTESLQTTSTNLEEQIQSQTNDIGTLITVTNVNANKIEELNNSIKDSLPLPTTQEINQLNLNLKMALYNLQNENLGKYNLLSSGEAQDKFDSSDYNNLVYITSQSTPFYLVDEKQNYNEFFYYFTKSNSNYIDIICDNQDDLEYYKNIYSDRIYKATETNFILMTQEEINNLTINSTFYLYFGNGIFSPYYVENDHLISTQAEYEEAKKNQQLYYTFMQHYENINYPIVLPFATYFEVNHTTIVTSQEYNNNKVSYIDFDSMSQIFNGNYRYFGDLEVSTFTIDHSEIPAVIIYLIAVNYLDNMKFNKIKFKNTVWSIINVGQYSISNNNNIDYYYVNFEAIIPKNFTNLNNNFNLNKIIVTGVYDINSNISYFKNIVTDL